jgi:hypothetical protein
MKRSLSRAAVVVWAFVLALWTAESRACNPTPAPGGSGDEIDERIDEASAKLRANKPWRLPGETGPASPIALESYRPAASSRNRWTFSLTPFAWAPAMCGSMTVRDRKVDVDNSIVESVEDVIDNFELAAMLRFEARYCKWSILVDLIYVDLGNDDTINIPGVPQIDAEWDTKQLTLQAMLGYEFARLPLGCGGRCFRPNVTFDALAGFRFYYMEGSIDLDPGPSFDSSRSWADPVVGIRALFHVTSALTFNVNADIGGFGIGSDLSWRLVAGVDYNLNRCVSIDAGWAILDVDYEDGSFAYDVRQSGPYLGVTFRL